VQKKRGLSLDKTAQKREIDSSEFLDDEEARLFKAVLSRIKRKYNVSVDEILDLTKDETSIPCTIFTEKLSPLETAVKYLKENLRFDYSKIAELMGRDRKTIWQAYKNAAKKHLRIFAADETEFRIPVSMFKSKLSVLEAAVVYLKEHFKLSYHNIGDLLHRNERTIWTVYSRAQKKNAAR
jgi:DNA-directed RNA polymerase specialized sigma24 family protein